MREGSALGGRLMDVAEQGGYATTEGPLATKEGVGFTPTPVPLTIPLFVVMNYASLVARGGALEMAYFDFHPGPRATRPRLGVGVLAVLQDLDAVIANCALCPKAGPSSNVLGGERRDRATARYPSARLPGFGVLRTLTPKSLF